MTKTILLAAVILINLSCSDSQTNNEADSKEPATAATTATTEVSKVPYLPSYVVYKDWKTGKPENAEMIIRVYEAWDGKSQEEMASYFADSTTYDFPDGTRAITTNKNVATKFRQWRNSFGETSNIPFSLISLYNDETDQDWVIAWTWNKWVYKDGKKDSMLYCDNWRIKNGKINYLNSLENKPSKKLSKALNEIVK